MGGISRLAHSTLVVIYTSAYFSSHIIFFASFTNTFTMSKRPFEEAVADVEVTTQQDIPKRKKSKKVKNGDVTVAKDTTTDIIPTEPDDSEQKSEKKKKRTPEEKAARAERKALKRAEKEQRKENGNDTPNDDEKAAAKAARKAEKARLKALKKGEKAHKDSDGGRISDSEVTEAQIPDRTTNGSINGAQRNAMNSKLSNLYEESTSTGATTPASLGYSDMAELAALGQTEIDEYLKKNHVTIDDPKVASGGLPLRPIISFDYLPITDEKQRAVFAGFAAPTPIQAASWPPLLARRDVVGVAETGSGKTLAFGIPCIQYIKNLPKKEQRGVKAVIVSPTRELACQIYDQLVKIATPAGLRAVVVYGGVGKDEQRDAIKRAHIIVATPGRLNDFIDEGSADLSQVGYVVLDEADRMLDKGFEDAIRAIISKTPATPNRQTLMFTATWPTSVRELASTFMTSPVKITIGENQSGELRANLRIEQHVEVIDPRAKERRLVELLKEHQSRMGRDARVLVFCLYKKEATRVEGMLKSKGFKVAGIHGDLGQAARTASLDAFKAGKVPLLVATDVAARGLDIPAVKLVINVTFPLTAEDYVHRIGRTGRAGNEGKSITLFTEHDKGLSGA